MSQEVALISNPGLDTPEQQAALILNIRSAKAELETESASADRCIAISVWARAIAAASAARRAWRAAREAEELCIRAERHAGLALGWDRSEEELFKRFSQDHEDAMFGNGKPRSELALEPRKQGAVQKLARMPEDLFDSVVTRLRDENKSLDAYTVLRIAAHESLTKVEQGILVSWDGSWYVEQPKSGRPKRATNQRSLEAVRAELHQLHQVSRQRPPRDSVARRVDEAFSQARRYANELEKLGDTVSGEAGRHIREAELLQAKVAETLFAAHQVLETAKQR